MRYIAGFILKNINSSGFKNSANLFSVSDSSKFGGENGGPGMTQYEGISLRNAYLIFRILWDFFGEDVHEDGVVIPVQFKNRYLRRVVNIMM